MYRFIGEQDAYSYFNMMAYHAISISIFFFFVLKRKSLSLVSRSISILVSKSNNKLGKIAEFVLAFIETYIIVRIIDDSSLYNRSFGALAGTGANYFAEFIMIPLLCILLSLLIVANPLKQIDFAFLIAPIQLAFFKLACFCNGCCWGIEWEHGLYNHHPDQPGRQVPVQLIEMIFAVVIFIFLLCYRKKAKPGTIYPMYLTLYSFTRFFSEFLKADYPNVLGPFKTYHILCAIGFVVGLALFFVIRKYGEEISESYDGKINSKIEKRTQKREEKIAAEKALREVEMQERLEKAKASRAKVKSAKK